MPISDFTNAQYWFERAYNLINATLEFDRAWDTGDTTFSGLADRITINDGQLARTWVSTRDRRVIFIGTIKGVITLYENDSRLISFHIPAEIQALNLPVFSEPVLDISKLQEILGFTPGKSKGLKLKEDLMTRNISIHISRPKEQFRTMRKRYAKLEAKFGKEHPKYTVTKWIDAIVHDDLRIGYWEYVWNEIRDEKLQSDITDKPDPKLDVRKYQRKIIRKPERLAAEPKILNDVLNMQVKDFVNAEIFTCRAINCLLTSIPDPDRIPEWRVIDFIKEGILRHPNCGRKTRAEIAGVLALHGVDVKEIAPDVW